MNEGVFGYCQISNSGSKWSNRSSRKLWPNAEVRKLIAFFRDGGFVLAPAGARSRLIVPFQRKMATENSRRL